MKRTARIARAEACIRRRSVHGASVAERPAPAVLVIYSLAIGLSFGQSPDANRPAAALRAVEILSGPAIKA